jgi:spoIIIJ-associated protein
MDARPPDAFGPSSTLEVKDRPSMDTPPAAPTSPRRLEDYLAAIESVLNRIIQQGGFALSFAIRPALQDSSDLESPEYMADFAGADADLLLERNGALLDALEHVVLKAVRLREELLGKIAFDCNDWRRTRIEELKLIAQVAAERVAESGAPFALSPMSPRERRIIHLALRDWPNLSTASEGVGPERKVVIQPVRPATRERGR